VLYRKTLQEKLHRKRDKKKRGNKGKRKQPDPSRSIKVAGKIVTVPYRYKKQ